MKNQSKKGYNSVTILLTAMICSLRKNFSNFFEKALDLE